MARLRALVSHHARRVLVLLALALAAKALVPAGLMLSPGADRYLTVTICADASGVPQQMRIAIPDRYDGHGDRTGAADKGQPCAFSGLGHAMLGGADPLLLAAALAFIRLPGLALRPALPARDAPFLRPPLRGPPSPRI
ncbi:hypothetical protein [Erythrobacter tepidarius]|uniref:hypothetical protein n=1 Tax=Erythrobacter tepidarius TaxID=60454 RepID=UPI000A3CD9C0|nr:hypothetical protein [Erythrobacter tepidarius]